MAEPNYGESITPAQLTQARALRQRQLDLQNTAGIPVTISAAPVVGLHNGEYKNSDFWLDVLDKTKGYAQKVTDTLVPVNPHNLLNKAKQVQQQTGLWQRLKNKVWPSSADTGSLRSAVETYLPGIKSLPQARQFTVREQGLINPDGTLKRNWTKQDTAQIRKKYNAWSGRYKKQGGEPSLDKWLSLHKSDAERKAFDTVQQKAERVAGRGEGATSGLRMAGNAYLLSNPFMLLNQQGRQLRSSAWNNLKKDFNKARSLPWDQQVAAVSGTMAPAAGAAGIAMFGAPLAKALLLPQMVYGGTGWGAKKLSDWYNNDTVQTAKAIANGNFASLNDKQKEILKSVQQKFALPEYNPENLQIVTSYNQAAQYLFNQARGTAHNAQRLGAAAASFIPLGKGSIKNYKPGTNAVWSLVNFFGTPKPEASTVQQRVLRGQLTPQQKEYIKGTKSTAQAIGKLKAAETQQQALSSLAPALPSWVTDRFVQKGIQSNIQSLNRFSSLSPEEQQKQLPVLLKTMQDFYSSPNKQALVIKYLGDSKNIQKLQGTFDKMSPQQMGQLLNTMNMLGEKDSKNLPATVTAIKNAITGVAQRSAVTRFQKGLSQQDPQKFEAHMKQWLPLFSKVSAQDGRYDALKDKAHKAVWGHVKKNPLFINKAMSFWAMQNGYNGLASFLGSNGAFYGTLVGLPLTIALMGSLFGGGKQAPAQAPQQAPQQYQPMAYAPRGITERGLIVG